VCFTDGGLDRASTAPRLLDVVSTGPCFLLRSPRCYLQVVRRVHFAVSRALVFANLHSHAVRAMTGYLRGVPALVLGRLTCSIPELPMSRASRDCRPGHQHHQGHMAYVCAFGNMARYAAGWRAATQDRYLRWRRRAAEAATEFHHHHGVEASQSCAIRNHGRWTDGATHSQTV